MVVIAREDDYTLGVLHSRAHELWSLRMGTSLEDRPRYTPTSTFETFPFPWPLDTPDEALSDEQRAHRDAIGEAARALDEARRHWLNPPEWVREEPDVVALAAPAPAARRRGRRARAAQAHAHQPLQRSARRGSPTSTQTLDAAVFAAYGWAEAGAPAEALGEEELLSRLLALNLERAGG